MLSMKRGFRDSGFIERSRIGEGSASSPSQPSSPGKRQSHEDRPERQSKAGTSSVQGTSSTGIFIPTEKELSHRDVFRRRQGLVTDRIRVMNRIRSKLLFLEMFLPEELSDWSVAFVKHLKGLRLSDRWEQERFDRLLEEYASLTQLINHQTKLLRELAKTEAYRTNVALLKSFSGMGVPTTMLLLLELGDVTRFRQGDQLSAYAGLSPSQYSSGERVCLGRIIGHQMRGE